jgi:hypothetical protein
MITKDPKKAVRCIIQQQAKKRIFIYISRFILTHGLEDDKSTFSFASSRRLSANKDINLVIHGEK